MNKSKARWSNAIQMSDILNTKMKICDLNWTTPPFDRFNLFQGDRTSQETPGFVMAHARPQEVSNPNLIHWNDLLASELGVIWDENNSKSDLAILSGQQVPTGSTPYAYRYGGHQFGHWAGQLGDGRAIQLGFIKSQKSGPIEVQLKGAGSTVYSRQGDGRAVLRSSLREYLCSEALYRLGIPTTRALSLVSTGDQVLRDPLYDGNPKWESGAVVTRTAPSFIRFGNFQIHAAYSEDHLLKELLDWVISQHFKELTGSFEEKVMKWFEEVCIRTAGLMVEWIRVGFVHGVMNTDNMSVLGLTIDYGPYGWVEAFRPDFTPNTTDRQRRYSYGQQPAVALWNLNQLANAIAVIVSQPEVLERSLELYKITFSATYSMMMAGKLGFLNLNAVEDKMMSHNLDRALQQSRADLTVFYRSLADWVESPVRSREDFDQRALDFAYTQQDGQVNVDALWAWYQQYRQRILKEDRTPQMLAQSMRATQPEFILRNHLVLEALNAYESGDRNLLDQLWLAIQSPYALGGELKALARKSPDWAFRTAGCSALSCSS